MGIRSTLYAIFYSIELIFSFTGLTVRLYFRRRKAKSAFRKELVASGLSQREAEEIAEEFPLKMGEVLKLLRRASEN